MVEDKTPEKVPLNELEKQVDTVDDSKDYLCGLGSWTPDWLQRFGNLKSFMTVYSTLGTIQAMGFVYFISSLTTIEKRFGIQSKTTGWMLSGNEVSQILLSLILSFYGGQRNRPVWLAVGVALSGLSCYILAAPHFIFGSGHKALALTVEYENEFKHINTSLPSQNNNQGLCNRHERKIQECPYESEDSLAALCIFMSQFVLGVGSTLYYSLGQPYIDDNIKKKTNTPIVLGSSMAVRMLGVLVSFFLVYFCLSLYINPFLTPTIPVTDQRWLGAWWLGWVMLGTAMILISSLLLFFPKKLKKTITTKTIQNEETNEKKELIISNGNIKEETKSNGSPNFYIGEKKSEDTFFPSLKRLLKNKLLMANTFAGCFYILGSSGYMTYMTKIQEVQFYRNTATANLTIGPIMLMAMIVGLLTSGYIISKFKPRPVFVLGWNGFIGVVYVMSQLSYIRLSCPDVEIVGFDLQTKSFSLINECNTGCGCEEVGHSPVFMEDRGLTFYSPCHAGCTTTIMEGRSTAYTNCSCIPTSKNPMLSNSSYSDMFETSSEILRYGYAPVGCAGVYAIYLAIGFIKHFLGMTGKIGNVLVIHRCVDEKDKSFAQGLGLFFASLFAFVPGPIIFGYIIDWTCLNWDSSCGKAGTCAFYDRQKFNFWLNLVSACFTGSGVLLDIAVCYFGRNLDFYEEFKDKKKEEISKGAL